jgi:hypothetical protein
MMGHLLRQQPARIIRAERCNPDVMSAGLA